MVLDLFCFERLNPRGTQAISFFDPIISLNSLFSYLLASILFENGDFSCDNFLPVHNLCCCAFWSCQSMWHSLWRNRIEGRVLPKSSFEKLIIIEHTVKPFREWIMEILHVLESSIHVVIIPTIPKATHGLEEFEGVSEEFFEECLCILKAKTSHI